MLYKLFLSIFLLLLSSLDCAFAEDARYRVEVLVLTHLDHHQEPREVRHLDDYSSALDFLEPQEDPEQADANDASEAREEEQSIDTATLAPIEEDPWSVVTHVEEMGPEMQEAWRRLRLSGPFRPLQYLSWEQGSNPPFPQLRVHDLVAVLIEDPWAEERLLQSDLSGTREFADTIDAPPRENAAGDEGPEDLPDPITYYQLDGTVSLSRQRFLHLAIAMEWREPVFDETSGVTPSVLPANAGDVSPQPVPTSFLVQRIEQSRPVRTGRMEYFDGPVLGVLAWVSDISDTVVTEPAD